MKKTLSILSIVVAIILSVVCFATAEVSDDVPAPVVYEARFMTLTEVSDLVNDIYRHPVYVEVNFSENGQVAFDVYLIDGDNIPDNEYRVHHVVLESTEWTVKDGQMLVFAPILYRIAVNNGNI